MAKRRKISRLSKKKPPAKTSKKTKAAVAVSKKKLEKKLFESFLYLLKILVIFSILIFSWTMIVVIIGLSQLIFLEGQELSTSDNQHTFMFVVATFIFVGLFSSIKTWHSWLTNKWLSGVWWGIFPFIYCGICVLLLSFL